MSYSRYRGPLVNQFTLACSTLFTLTKVVTYFAYYMRMFRKQTGIRTLIR